MQANSESGSPPNNNNNNNKSSAEQQRPQKFCGFFAGKKSKDFLTEKALLLPKSSLDESPEILHPSTSAPTSSHSLGSSSSSSKTANSTTKNSYGSTGKMPCQKGSNTSENSTFELTNENGQYFGNGDVDDVLSTAIITTPMENQYQDKIVLADETLHIYGYKKCQIKSAIVFLVSILTLGIARLILYWKPEWLIRLTARRCLLVSCDHVLVRDEHENITYRSIKILNSKNGIQLVVPKGCGKMMNMDKIRFFTHRKFTYFWHPIQMRFITLNHLEDDILLSHFHDCVEPQSGLSAEEIKQRIIIYGKNLIEVKVKPIYVLLFKEVISPFYIFQICSVTVWYFDDYAMFAAIIVLMSAVSIITDVIQIRKQETKLRSMVHTHENVQVIRNGGQTQETSSDTLVPGDILLIPPHGCILQCDAIVMTGSVIVNESMLTGESVPITKVALPELDEDSENPPFTFKEHSKHVLFCGTQVLQTRYYGGKPVQAVVLRTAYSTLKGQLVRSVMYPKPVDFRFTKDLFKFVGFLACIAGLGFIYTIVIMYSREASLRKILLRSLDIITIVVPPALPAAMSIGMVAALIRLRAKQIFCISPSTINICGAINNVCFDKTGTLTEDGLDFNCLRAVYKNLNEPEFGHEMFDFVADELPHKAEILKAVATCHSLTRIDKEITGDPLDKILFLKTGWIMDEGTSENVDETEIFDKLQPTVIHPPPLQSAETDVELAILRQFTFSSSLQRMAVIVHNVNAAAKNMHLYCKGAPEMIASLCRPETVPSNYQIVVNNYAQHGYRLIAVASRELNVSYVKAQKIKREQVECDLEMLGLIVMENRLKPQSTGVINQLNRANIRTIMITGDNLLTAMSVARECGIIRPNKKAFLLESSHTDGITKLALKQSVSSSEDVVDLDGHSSIYDIEQNILTDSSYHVAISGPTLSIICEQFPHLLEKLVCVCDVYARMSPDQKQLLVNKLQEVDYTVAMCGDGANDCAALKAAHAGISLSEAEASIAAPFTSKIPDIRCVPMIICEGRAALVTSFGVFKYMAGYSLTQFITIMQLYWLNTNLTDFQFLYIDLALITVVALFFGNTPACDRLSRTPPPARLLSLASMLSIIGQLFIIGSFQVFVFIYITYQPWFIPYAMPIGDEMEDRRSMQGTAIFCVSMFQYLTLAVIYSKGFPYRKPLYSNKTLSGSLIILFVISTILTIQPPEPLIRFMEYDPIPYLEDKLLLFILGILSGCISYLYETFVIQHLILDVREKKKQRKHILTESSESKLFEKILSKIGNEPQWIRNNFCNEMAQI